MHNFKIDHANKTVNITVAGFFTEAEAASYLAEYQKTVKSINASQYSLIVDGREQKTVTQNVLEEMQQAVDMYLASGYKKVHVTLPSSPTAAMQVKRLKGYERINWIKSLAEAV